MAVHLQGRFTKLCSFLTLQHHPQEFHSGSGETQPDFPESTAGFVGFVCLAVEALAINQQNHTTISHMPNERLSNIKEGQRLLNNNKLVKAPVRFEDQPGPIEAVLETEKEK